jgi:hypothetical protein
MLLLDAATRTAARVKKMEKRQKKVGSCGSWHHAAAAAAASPRRARPINLQVD